jgi:two-component system LytT family response regulator
MSVIRTLVVDDEALCRKGVRLMLASDPSFEIVGECSDGERALDAIGRLHPDLVFLDIRMPGCSGFEVAQRIPPASMPLIVFVTAYGDHAIRAFDVQAVDYILKPFARTRFKAAMDHIKAKHRDRTVSNLGLATIRMLREWDCRDTPARSEALVTDHRYLEHLKVPDRGGETLLRMPDIEWIEGADYYVNLHTRERSYLHRERLKNLERQLPPSLFVRVHKSAIVNVAHVVRIVTDGHQHDQVMMLGGAAVPVSRLRKAALLLLLETRSLPARRGTD